MPLQHRDFKREGINYTLKTLKNLRGVAFALSDKKYISKDRQGGDVEAAIIQSCSVSKVKDKCRIFSMLYYKELKESVTGAEPR